MNFETSRRKTDLDQVDPEHLNRKKESSWDDMGKIPFAGAGTNKRDIIDILADISEEAAQLKKERQEAARHNVLKSMEKTSSFGKGYRDGNTSSKEEVPLSKDKKDIDPNQKLSDISSTF